MSSKSQMPKNAKMPLQRAWDQQPNNNPGNMAEKHVDAAQRQQAMEFLQRMMMGKGGYTPIIKSLNQLGVEFRTVSAGEDLPADWHDEDIIAIRANDLMVKEWRHINELEAVEGENA